MARDDRASSAGGAGAGFLDAVRDDGSVYVVAEAGVNHGGDLATARRLVDAAAEAGADAVKFQTFDADRLATRDAPQADYQRATAPDDSQHAMLRRYELDRAAHEELRTYCRERSVTFLSTPFDRESATLLDELDVPAIKLGSGELDNYPLLEHVAGFGRPLIVSTGMGTLAEVEVALERVRSVDPDASVVVTHCTSAYPAPEADVNLRAMQTMARELDVPVGYSDHTTAVETPGFAAAAGAVVVEKHLTLDRDADGPDHEASTEPEAFARAVDLARAGARISGSATKRPVPSEAPNRATVRKSLHAAATITPGEEFTPENVAVLRPAAGLTPALYDEVVGRCAGRELAPDDPIAAADVDGELDVADVPRATLADDVAVADADDLAHRAQSDDPPTEGSR